ncbi:MAG TPA: IclR family transcriptional regulator [Bryobacteraceae bacterium]|nr:IclR family transcriptional regulator [Bryobacteraceae bacterium]
MPSKNYIELVEKTFNVLEALAEEPGGASLGTLASRAGLVKSSAFRILFTLKDLGYVEQESQNGDYRLTLKTLILGRRAAVRPTLANVAHSHLVAARDQTKESTALAEWRRGKAILIQAAEAANLLSLQLQVGDGCALHASALGKAIAAHLPADELEAALGPGPLQRFTDRTITSRSQVASELLRVRKNGVAVNDGETVEGAYFVGAPVFDANDRVCAALSICAPTARCTPAKRQTMGLCVAAAASAVSRDLKALGFAASV